MSRFRTFKIDGNSFDKRDMELYFKIEDDQEHVMANFCVTGEGLYYYKPRSHILSPNESEDTKSSYDGFLSFEKLKEIFEALPAIGHKADSDIEEIISQSEQVLILEHKPFIDRQTEQLDKREIRSVTPKFPKLKFSTSPICSIEIDVDSLSKEEKYQYGGWEDVIKKITAQWVEDNDFSGTATIWAFGGQSVNFHHQSFSMFYAVSGMPKNFRDYLASGISVLGKHVKPYSDSVLPNLTEGWDARCHIEDGKVWEELDAASWQEVGA
jgi:hypothetical protein